MATVQQITKQLQTLSVPELLDVIAAATKLASELCYAPTEHAPTEQVSDIPEPKQEEPKPKVKVAAKTKPAQAKAKQTTKSVSVKEVAEFKGTTLEGMSFREAQAHVKSTINALNIKGIKASIKRMELKATQAAGLVSIINHVNAIITLVTEGLADKEAIAKVEACA